MKAINKRNELIFLVAKKGSGKSFLAEALIRYQDKPAFWITPIIKAYYPDKLDSINEISTRRDNISYIEITDRAEFCDFMLELFDYIKATYPQGAFIVIDELDYYHDSKISHKSPLYAFINMGRHLQCDLLAISRRPQDLPKTLRDNADTLMLGNFNDLNNIDKLGFLEQWHCEAVSNLKQHEFLKIDISTGEAFLIKLSESCIKKLQANVKYLKD